MKSSRSTELFFAVALVVVTGLLMVGTHLRWFPIDFTVGPFRFTHWLGWIGVVFISVSTPIFYVLRRQYPKSAKAMINVHCLGNLFSFMLISVHFTEELTRAVHPQDRTGLATFIIVAMLVATGFLQRFQLLGKEKIYPLTLTGFYTLA